MQAKYAEIPERLWRNVEPLLPKESAKPLGGRPRNDDRKVLAGIVYRMRTGCQWKAIPREFGSGSTCFDRMQLWSEMGIFGRIFAEMVRYYDQRRGVQLKWASLDGVIVKAPKGGRPRGQTLQIAERAA